MANGYGSSLALSRVFQGQTAPPGFHYMPDGSLMSDQEHFRLYGNLSNKVIKSFDLDLSDISAEGERRAFSITGDNNPEFILEIKNNATGDYYNFTTEEFQSTYSSLQEVVGSGITEGVFYFQTLLLQTL